MKPASQNPVSMPNSEPTIQCSNPQCVASNSFSRRFCKSCKTPMIKRYLWEIGEAQLHSESAEEDFADKLSRSRLARLRHEKIETSRTFDLAATAETLAQTDRYQKIGNRVFLDTRPGETPQIPDKLPESIVNYLQLFAYFPYVPQVYGQLDHTENWLLDYGTVPVDSKGKLIYSNLLPTVTSLWSEATPLKQLNWLQQIANLWQPLAEKSMNATLINPDLIRVNSSFIQLLELEPNGENLPTLQDLGKLWQRWLRKAHKKSEDIIAQLSQRIASGAINNIEQVKNVLNHALELCSHSQEYSYEIFAVSDSGPTRSNNQDKAYPDSATPIKSGAAQKSIAIVCDGVGGHEGGEIASQKTVSYLYDRVSQMSWDSTSTTPTQVSKQLLDFTNEANDAISRRNDSEQRHERQRMGTTLVMTIAQNHEVYLTHVGDSRIYLITRNSCHQLTTDDDLASREVRLGYAIYRDALRYPSAGALIQALGMRDSKALHANSQRLVVDDDCLLLLCSDGLSDFDRVEQYWRDAIAPVLNGKTELTKAVQTLIKIGNDRNGHDNVTAALVHCRVKPKPNATEKNITWSDIEYSLGKCFMGTENTIEGLDIAESSEKRGYGLETATKSVNTSEKKRKSLLPWLAIGFGFVFLVSLGILYYSYSRDRQLLEEDTSSQIIEGERK